MQLTLFHPDTPALRAERDALLTRALRPDPLPFSIAAEYPLVLADDAAARSFCFAEAGRLVAHANLLARETTDGRRVGLVGNVATEAAERGRGVMRSVFAALAERARADGLEALFLWSDLGEFYQKMGFRSHGLERRYQVEATALLRAGARAERWLTRAPHPSRHADRHAYAPTLVRTAGEFARQLTVPGRALIPSLGPGYLIEGKGWDMLGVVHEWGADSPTALCDGLLALMAEARQSSVLLLAPAHLDPAWRGAIEKVAAAVEEAPMALMMPLTATADADFARLFIWGTDSI